MWSSYPSGPINLYSYYVGFSPPTTVNPYSKFPTIHPQAFISPFSFVVGDVAIHDHVFIAPFVSIRADEGTPFYIGSYSNLQDGVILHGLKNQYVERGNTKYSIYISNRVSCAHGSLIHGPALIEEDVFVGFNAIVSNATIGRGSFLSTGAVVSNGVELRPHSFVPPGAYIDTQDKANSLAMVPLSESAFAKEVQRVNQEFPPTYAAIFGQTKCTCGIVC